MKILREWRGKKRNKDRVSKIDDPSGKLSLFDMP
jgi:hypothetical protein